MIRFHDDRYVRLLLDLLRHKYSTSKPDLIISVYNGALGFVLKHAPDLFPEVPIVFGGVERQFVESRTLGPNITGILYVNSFRETLDLALNLHPGTRHVAIVAGADIIGRAWSSAAREAYRPYKNQIEFIDFSGLPMPAILEKVSNLPPKTVVIYIALLEDGDGKKLTAPESLTQISRASNAPVYSFWDLVLGNGMVGGYLSSAEEKGKEIAELGLRILDGEKLAELREIQEGVESLTPREREVFALVVTGMLNKKIAFELGISEKTIKVHRARVMQKMQAESLADLVRLAAKVGAKPVTEST